MDGGYGKSCAHWYNRSFDFDQDTPYPIDLGLAGTSGNKPAIYLYPSSTGSRGSEILVTEEYNKMYYRILERATNPYRRGVLITGEPGIGTFRFRAQLLILWTDVVILQENQCLRISCSHDSSQSDRPCSIASGVNPKRISSTTTKCTADWDRSNTASTTFLRAQRARTFYRR